MRNPYFTIFTPVYNGALTIERVFKSVKDQSFNDFEWIIVNDGSTDETDSLIRKFMINNPEIDIIYLTQKNAGKHFAWNSAVKISKGLLFIPADADDSFSEDTLNFFYTKWESIDNQIKDKLSGINVLCIDNNSRSIVGSPFPKDGIISNNFELQFKFKISGEKWGCIRTDLLKKRPFPEKVGSHYPESYIWFEFSKHYNNISYNKPLRQYYTNPDGITQSVNSTKWSKNMAKISLHYNIWLINNFSFKLLIYSPMYLTRIVKMILFNLFVLVKQRKHISICYFYF